MCINPEAGTRIDGSLTPVLACSLRLSLLVYETLRRPLILRSKRIQGRVPILQSSHYSIRMRLAT